MKYSSNWLNEHIDAPLPTPEELARIVTIKAFEVEGTETHGDGDTIFDIKVLPDRAHDALSHRGMAREVAALFGLSRKVSAPKAVTVVPAVARVRVNVEDAQRCPRYIGMRVDGITVAPSPDKFAAKLSAIGARAISNIVDLTNIILFDLGQPMHAFDAAKVAGGITVRLAKAGEAMTTLDGKALTFDGTELVIADDEAVLALAGVKGGKKAEVDAQTTSIILESANFDATQTRKTSTKHGIKTDASKRYENGMTSALAAEAMLRASAMLAEMLPTAAIGAITDVYPNPEVPHAITITIKAINTLLGGQIDTEAMEAILARIGFAYEKNVDAYTIHIPAERLDLRITQDMVEEIGRHYGYDKLSPTLPTLKRQGLPHKRLYYGNIIRNFLTERGYSEVFTYSFAKEGEGEIEVINPVGLDRPFMRSSLILGMKRALDLNLYNSALLALDDIGIFEMGNIFTNKAERTFLALGAIAGSRKRWKKLEPEFLALTEELCATLGVTPPHKETVVKEQYGIIEVDLDALIAQLPEPKENAALKAGAVNIAYKTLSVYPFIVRDVSLFVPLATSSDEVEEVIRAHMGELAQSLALIDVFEQPEQQRKSFAFRMVLQSYEKTLADDEANVVADRVVQALKATNENWQMRS